MIDCFLYVDCQKAIIISFRKLRLIIVNHMLPYFVSSYAPLSTSLGLEI